MYCQDSSQVEVSGHGLLLNHLYSRFSDEAEVMIGNQVVVVVWEEEGRHRSHRSCSWEYRRDLVRHNLDGHLAWPVVAVDRKGLEVVAEAHCYRIDCSC